MDQDCKNIVQKIHTSTLATYDGDTRARQLALLVALDIVAADPAPC